MSLAAFAVRRPLAVVSLSVGLALLGVFYALRMPVSLFPKVRLPFVTVRVALPGASPQVVESTVVLPLEAEFRKMPAISRQISFVRPGGVEFILGFRFGVPELEASTSVRHALDRAAAALPREALLPEVRTIDPASTPLVVEVLDSSVEPIQSAALVDLLVQVPGVAAAEILGVPPQRNWLRLDSSALLQQRVAPLEILQSLISQGHQVPWGSSPKFPVGGGAREDLDGAQVNAPIAASAQWDPVLSLGGGRMVALPDVGTFSSEPVSGAPRVLIDGRSAAAVAVYKRQDADALAVVHAVKSGIQSWQQSTKKTSRTVLDQSEYIAENAREVWLALLWGGLFAMVTVALSLRDFRSALITGTALPISIGVTFWIIGLAGFSINMLTLLALSLAVGLLIDDAVIVRESISRELERRRDAVEASLRGTARVFAPVVATTACIIAVFLPVALMDGMVGQFFLEFGITICAAVVVSTLVAFTMDPMLSARFSKRHHRRTVKGSWRIQGRRALVSGANWSFRWPFLVLFCAAVCLVTAVWLAVRQGVDFMASEDKSQVLVEVVGVPGEGDGGLDSRVQRISSLAKGVPEVAEAVAFVAAGSDPNRALIRIMLQPKGERSTGHLEIAQQIRSVLRREGLVALVREPPPIEGVGGEPPLSMYLYGEDLDVLQRRAVDLRSQLADIVGTGSVVVDTAGATPSYLAMVDSMSAVSQGVEPLQVFMTGRIAGDGLEVPGVHHNPNQSPGQARGLWLGLTAETPFQNKMPPAADPLQRFGGLLVPGAKGLLPLESFFKLKLQDEHQAIDRENGVRKVVLYGSPDGSVALSHLLAAWQAIADNEKAPLRAEVGGDKAILGEMVGSFGFALVGGVLCVFVLLVILYENIWMPALVLISLPLAAIGGLLGLWATGERLAMGSMIGFVLLIGLSAKNAILLVDGINRFKVRLPIRQAVLMAVRGRVRPILMTSVALVIGMFPTVFLEGSGSEFRAPMALSIIAGMVTSTALSFFVIPALFGALSSFLRVHPRSSTVGQ